MKIKKRKKKEINHIKQISTQFERIKEVLWVHLTFLLPLCRTPVNRVATSGPEIPSLSSSPSMAVPGVSQGGGRGGAGREKGGWLQCLPGFASQTDVVPEGACGPHTFWHFCVLLSWPYRWGCQQPRPPHRLPFWQVSLKKLGWFYSRAHETRSPVRRPHSPGTAWNGCAKETRWHHLPKLHRISCTNSVKLQNSNGFLGKCRYPSPFKGTF